MNAIRIELCPCRYLSTQQIDWPSGGVKLFFGAQVTGPCSCSMSVLFFTICKVDSNFKWTLPSGTSYLLLKHGIDGFRSNRSIPVDRRDL
jgi:hypothetical protein